MISRRPPKAPTGMPPPMTLPSTVRSGRTPYTAWAPPGRDPEPRHHLVEYEHRAVLVAALPKRLQKPRHRRYAVHVSGNRLDDHRSDPFAEPGERLAHCAGIVEAQRESVLGKSCGDAGRGRHAEGERARTRLDEQGIRVPVVAAFEFHDGVPGR